jgi:hypothetical protein
MIPSRYEPEAEQPILLFDNECGVCRRIAGWVTKSARLKSGKMSLVVGDFSKDDSCDCRQLAQSA